MAIEKELGFIGGKVKQALEALVQPPPESGTTLSTTLVKAHSLVRGVKKQCQSWWPRETWAHPKFNFKAPTVLKCVQWATIAMHETVACCVVCALNMPLEDEFMKAIKACHPEAEDDDCRSQVLKAYHHVYKGTSVKVFSSKASRDAALRGRVRPRRDKKTSKIEEDIGDIDEIELIVEDFSADEIDEMLTETMTVTVMPPEVRSTMMGEPFIIEISTKTEIMPSVAGLVFWPSLDFDPVTASEAAFPPGELFTREARCLALLQVQQARRCSAPVVAVTDSDGVQRLA